MRAWLPIRHTGLTALSARWGGRLTRLPLTDFPELACVAARPTVTKVVQHTPIVAADRTIGTSPPAASAACAADACSSAGWAAPARDRPRFRDPARSGGEIDAKVVGRRVIHQYVS